MRVDGVRLKASYRGFHTVTLIGGPPDPGMAINAKSTGAPHV